MRWLMLAWHQEKGTIDKRPGVVGLRILLSVEIWTLVDCRILSRSLCSLCCLPLGLEPNHRDNVCRNSPYDGLYQLSSRTNETTFAFVIYGTPCPEDSFRQSNLTIRLKQGLTIVPIWGSVKCRVEVFMA